MTSEARSLSLKKTSNGYNVSLELIGSLDTGTLEKDLDNFVKNRFLFENALANRELERAQLSVLEALEKKLRSIQQPKKQKNLVSEKELLASKRRRAVRRLAAIALNDTIITAIFRNRFLDPGETIKRLNQTIALDDRNEWLYLHRGNVFSRLKDIIFASADFERTVLLNPYINRAAAFTQTGRLEEALTDSSKAIRINPSLGLAYNIRGYILELMGKPKEALVDYYVGCLSGFNLACQNHNRLEQIINDK